MAFIAENVSLLDKTSFLIGGKAHYYCRIQSTEDIATALVWAREKGASVFVLGKGTNVLISDTGWPGIVIDMSALSGIAWQQDSARCKSGTLLHDLVKEAIRRSLGGIEELAGIPGTIGGACFMNAGAFGQEIGQSIESVSGVEIATGEHWTLSHRDIFFEYRKTSLQQKQSIITEVTVRFKPDQALKLFEVYQTILRRRHRKQPLKYPNCGSVFKRPFGQYAGSLIESCGLKGFRIGDAMISPKHGNFIINLNHATATDVRALIVACQQRVYEKSGVLLEPEVLFIGQFSVPLFHPEPAGLEQ